MITTNTDGHPFDSCAAMMMPQVPMAPDPMQQMAATQHALINQQALLMVRSGASFSLLFFFIPDRVCLSLCSAPLF